MYAVYSLALYDNVVFYHKINIMFMRQGFAVKEYRKVMFARVRNLLLVKYYLQCLLIHVLVQKWP